MYRFLPITDVYAREILDSRGNPTIEVEVLAEQASRQGRRQDSMRRWNYAMGNLVMEAWELSLQWNM